MAKKNLRVAMIAPPWLKIPPEGYGGIEIVIQGLMKGLKKLDVDIELFSIRQTKLPGVKNHYLYNDEQYKHIHQPLYDSGPIAIAQIMFAINKIQEDGKFDLIHDHSVFVGPLALYWAGASGKLPPSIHTHHGPPFSSPERIDIGIPDNMPMWRQFKENQGLYFVGISDALMKPAPPEMRPFILPAVHNAIEVNKFPFKAHKGRSFITLARFNRDKGQHIAVQLCRELKVPLKMAGTVAGINTRRQLALELANPLSKYRGYSDFRYYSDNILPATILNPRIRYVGNVSGSRKMEFMANAKALLNPIDWEEPFGLAPVEAMACGTPVIAMNRGAMPELIEHGVNGFLANNIDEFREYMKRIDEINPEDCRRVVEEKFSVSVMAQNYLDRYNQVLELQKKRRT